MIVLPQDLAVHKGIELHIVRTAVLIQVLVKNKIDARGFADVLAVGDLDNGIHLRLNADAGRSELAGILQGIQDLLTDVPQLAQRLEADHQRTFLRRLTNIPRHRSARSNRTNLQRGAAVPEVDRQELACASVEENRTVGAHRVPVRCVPTRTRGTVARCAVAPGRITIVVVLTIVERHSDISPFDCTVVGIDAFRIIYMFQATSHWKYFTSPCPRCRYVLPEDSCTMLLATSMQRDRQRSSDHAASSGSGSRCRSCSP